MKTYIITVKDTTNFSGEEYFAKRAEEALKNSKSAYCAIYGYEDSDKKKVFFDKPLIKYSNTELMDFIKGMQNGKASQNKTIYTIFKDNIDEDE